MAVASLLAIVLSGCVTLSSHEPAVKPMTLYRNEGEMRSEVLRHLKLGMPIEDAKTTMEAHGFTCSFGRKDWCRGPNADNPFCLICSKTESEGFSCSQTVQVYVLFEAGAVKEVEVKVSHTCA
jgi:hypothetical protein